jgi:hypothetical protein
MNKNSSPPLSEDRGEAEARSKVRVYRFTGTLKTEFSNLEQAEASQSAVRTLCREEKRSRPQNGPRPQKRE